MSALLLKPAKPPARILCLGAHADDIEIGCGGTLIKLLSSRPDLHLHWVVLSGNDERAAEARSAAQRIVKDGSNTTVEIKQFRDAHFEYAEAVALKAYFHQLSKTVNPDLVFSHRRGDAHQDHRFVGELTWQHFRSQMILEYEIPKYEGDLGQPSVYVELDEKTAFEKVDTIVTEFPSQHEKPWFTASTFEALARIRGIECNAPSGLAEAFHCRKMLVS